MATDNNNINRYFQHMLKRMSQARTVRIRNNKLYIPSLNIEAGDIDPLHPEQSTENISRAMEIIREAGLKQTYEYVPVLGADGKFTLPTTLPMSGHLDQDMVKAYALAWAKKHGPGAGAGINIQTFNQGNKTAYEMLKSGRGLGIEGKSSIFWDLYHIENGERVSATTREVVEFLSSQGLDFGYSTNGIIKAFGKASKRMRQVSSEQAVSVYREGMGPVTAVYDPAKLFQYGRGAKPIIAGKGAVDAAIHVSPGYARQLGLSSWRKAQKLESENKILEAKAARREAKSYFRAARTGEGNIFVQNMGLDIHGIGGISAEDIDALGTGAGVKGVARVNKWLTSKISKELGKKVDIVAALPNINTEVPLRGAFKANAWFMKPSHVNYIDDQTLAAHPEIYGDLDSLAKFNMLKVDELIANIREGKLPEKVTEAISASIYQDSEKALDFLQFGSIESKKKFLAEWEALVSSGATPGNMRQFAKQIVNQYAQHISQKGLEIPDAISAVLISNNMNNFASGKIPYVKPGTIRLVNGRWTLHKDEIDQFNAIVGGADADDKIKVLMRWDPTRGRSGKLVGIATRNPTTLGEIVVKEITDDETILNYLRYANPEKAIEYEEKYSKKAFKKIATKEGKEALSAERDRFLSQNAIHNDTSNLFQLTAIPDGEGGWTTAIGDKYAGVVRFKDTVVKTDEADLYGSEYAERFTPGVIKGKILGRHENMTMITNNFLNSLTEEHLQFLRESPLYEETEILHGETVLDLLTQGGRLIDKGTGKLINVEEQTAHVYRQIGRAAGLLAEAFPGFKAFDPTLLYEGKKRGLFGLKHIQEGIASVLRQPTSLLEYDANDPAAQFSQTKNLIKEISYRLRVSGEEMYPDIRPDASVVSEKILGGPDSNVRNAGRRLLHEWLGDIDELNPDEGDKVDKQIKWEEVNRRLEERITSYSDDVAEQNRLWAAALEHSNAVGYGDAMFIGGNKSLMTARLHHYGRLVSGELEEGTTEYERTKRLALSEINLARRAPIENASKASRDIIEENPLVEKAYQKLIDRGEIAKMWEKPLFRRGTYAVAGLLALGVARTILHRNPTPEQMGGSDYVPGGNAYDTYSSQNNYSGQSSGTDFNSGVRYTINARGDFERSNLQSQMMGIDSSFNFSGGSTYSLPSSPNQGNEQDRLLSGF